MERCHFDVIQQYASFFGDLAFFGYQLLGINFRSDPENPFLFRFLAPDHSDHGTDADDKKQ